jgi:multiple sugar transport system permease protein
LGSLLPPLSAWAIAAILAAPIVWMVGTSLKPAGDYVSTSISLLPGQPTLEHYRSLMHDDILGKFVNSMIVASGSMMLALAAGFPAAYALVRLRFPKGLDVACLVVVLLIKLAPPIALAIPLYQVLRTLGLLDSLAGLVLAYQVYTLPFAIWLLLGFVRQIPVSYEEAALIDGATLFQRLRLVVLPMMRPGLLATAIFLVILSWNEFTYALLFVQTPSRFTLPVYIASLITEDETFWGRLAAIGLLASLPVLAFIALTQKGLTRSLGGGLK